MPVVEHMHACRSLLSVPQLQFLEVYAPERWTANQASFAIDYANRPPLLAVPMSALFGPVQQVIASLPKPMLSTGRAADASIRQTKATGADGAHQGQNASMLTLVLLSPRRLELARVPAHELAGFWERHYSAVRKELMRRYAKHKWPIDPTAASAKGDAKTTAKAGR